MKNPVYVQIFSMTDHAQALQGRYEGSYNGINAELQTSEYSKGKLRVAKQTKIQQSTIPSDFLEKASIVLAYRHSDTGILNGTSELLFSILKAPWEEIPGLSFLSLDKKETLQTKLWDQEMSWKKNHMYRIHFGKTIVYVKNFGKVKDIEFTDKILTNGPSSLHTEDPDQNITIAPPSGSGMQVKMGQETQN